MAAEFHSNIVTTHNAMDHWPDFADFVHILHKKPVKITELTVALHSWLHCLHGWLHCPMQLVCRQV